MRKTEKELLDHWNTTAKKALQGKKILEVRYLNDEEMKRRGWYNRPICFFLDDGTECVVSSDDEGNDGGSLFYDDKVLPSL